MLIRIRLEVVVQSFFREVIVANKGIIKVLQIARLDATEHKILHSELLSTIHFCVLRVICVEVNPSLVYKEYVEQVVLLKTR